MGYVKVVKNKNFFKRYKVKYRRRREHKTDYELRRGLVKQDKRKYNAPKWRFVVRQSNTDVTCQIACARATGDQVLCVAYSHELPRYGLKVGLTNYAAYYCTGLLLARRLLQKLKLDKYYKGKKSLNGNLFLSRVKAINWQGSKHVYRPFKCILDCGLSRTTLGAKIFGALKGAVDGGLDIPHSPKRFAGFVKGGKEKDEKDQYNADVHREKIYGGAVSAYMKLLQDKDNEKYERHFSRYIAENIGADDLEDLYHKVHSAIRKDPRAPPKKHRDWKKMQPRPQRMKKLTLDQRKQRRLDRIAQLRAQADQVTTQPIAEEEESEE